MSRFYAQPGSASRGRGPAGSSTSSSRMLARVMDDLIRVPGTNFGIGLDALIGLIPGVGDAAGSVISGLILVDAVKHRVPLPVLALMGWNLLLDAVLGLIPAVGDLVDVAHRANVKNMRLLESTVASGRTVHTSSRGYLLQAVLMVVLILAVVIGFALVAIYMLLRVLGLVGAA